MKLELMYGGLDDVLKDIKSELVHALSKNSYRDRALKDQHICRAIGLVQGVLHLTREEYEDEEGVRYEAVEED